MLSQDDRFNFEDLIAKPEKAREFMGAAVILAVLAWVACAASPILFGIPVSTSGPWGDTFNAASSMISLLTLLGLAYTIIIQHEGLRIAREDSRKSDEARCAAERLMLDQAKAALVSARLDAANSLAQLYIKWLEHESPRPDFITLGYQSNVHRYTHLLESYLTESQVRSELLGADVETSWVILKGHIDAVLSRYRAHWNGLSGFNAHGHRNLTVNSLMVYVDRCRVDVTICKDLMSSLAVKPAHHLDIVLRILAQIQAEYSQAQRLPPNSYDEINRTCLDALNFLDASSSVMNAEACNQAIKEARAAR